MPLPPQSDPPLSPRKTLPTMYDLPSELPGEPGCSHEFHVYQPPLLRQTFQPVNIDPNEVFVGIDLNIYYNLRYPNWYKRPDWFAVVGVPRLYDNQQLRLSYVMWQEQVCPFVVVELLSPGTEDEDLGQTVRQPGKPPTKWQVYEQILRVPYYIVYSRYTEQIQAFHWVAGEYQPMTLNEGRVLIPQLGLSLGLWQGSYENIERLWLRWFTLEGEMILTQTELGLIAQQQVTEAQQQVTEAQQQAIEAQQQARLAEEKAAKLAAKLREMNLNPDDFI